MNKINTLPISVVIASIGGKSLFKTINSISSGSAIPKEIIVSLPPKVKIKYKDIYNISIIIVNSLNKGQVAQRSFGFKFCKQNFIVQSDDDMIYEKDTFINLYNNINKLGKKNVVGPIYKNVKNNKNITEIKKGTLGFVISIFHKFICLAPWSSKRMGALTKIGMGYGVDPSKLKTKTPFNVKWLNGGCIMCYKEDLILENYFPFEGKAYFEDTIHSILWNNNNNKLWVLPEALCFQEKDDYLLDDLNSYKDRFKIHKYVVQMLNGSFLFLYIWRIIFIFKLLVLKIYNVIKI